MKEKDLNLTIKNNIIQQGGFAFKIPDPVGIAAKMAIKNCFDGFGYTKQYAINFESKLLKKLEAFNFSLIKSHQIQNLKLISKLTEDWKGTKCLNVILLGIWIPRKEILLFVFDISYIVKLISEGNKSILKKELLKLIDENKYISIKKKIFDTSLLEEKMISN